MMRQHLTQVQLPNPVNLPQSMSLVRPAITQSEAHQPPETNPPLNATPWQPSRLNQDFSQVPAERTWTTIQARLEIGAVNDPYEQEADRVADEVVRWDRRRRQFNQPEFVMPTENRILQMKPSVSSQPGQSERVASPKIEAEINQARSSGQTLSSPLRASMEPTFRTDFSQVKVHTDLHADRLNRSLGSRAFTSQQNIFFRQGAYQPQSESGQALIAHELTHVVQQNPFLAHRNQQSEPLQPQQDGANIQLSVGQNRIQRDIELVDDEERIYAELDPSKPAHAFGQLYYTGQKFARGRGLAKQEFPIFTPVDPIDNFAQDDGLFDDTKTEKEIETTRQVLWAKLVTYAQGKKYFKVITDEGELNELISLKQGQAIYGALFAPLLKDPKRKGRFANRFPEAAGTLISDLTKEQIGEDLKNIPLEVNLQCDANLFKIASAWAKNDGVGKCTVTQHYVYIRDDAAINPVNPRKPESKFILPNVNTSHEADPNLKAPFAPAPTVANAYSTTGWIDHKAYVRRKPRGQGGQIAAMSKWNALAYAAYLKANNAVPSPLNLNQDWEWLHIRGAQLGGATTPDNLVAGTSTANSLMIPWENKIAKWTNSASPDYPLSLKYDGYRFVLPLVGTTVLGTKITISIAAEAGLPGIFGRIPKASPLVVEFDPLAGRIFDRISEKLTRKFNTREVLAENQHTLPDQKKRKANNNTDDGSSKK